MNNLDKYTESGPGYSQSPINVAAIAEQKFSAIKAYDLTPVTERYAKDYHLDRVVAAEHFLELKKFLAICAASDAPIGMAGPVDDAWHTFLIFTREYQAFGDKIGKFIHHVPDVDEDDQEGSSIGYTTFLQIYELAFKECPPASIWPYRRTTDGLFASQSCAGCGGQGGGGGAGCSHCKACKND